MASGACVGSESDELVALEAEWAIEFRDVMQFEDEGENERCNCASYVVY